MASQRSGSATLRSVAAGRRVRRDTHFCTEPVKVSQSIQWTTWPRQILLGTFQFLKYP